ncbi:MAG TPA: glycosyltransferase family 2 protein [Aliiroseovarius sp.]|nr:glycosyltransferase family 2 protein [Aliiroseovarius sp.]
MRVFLHIGLEHCGAPRLQQVLADKREQLARTGVLFPRIGGAKNQTRLFMAVSDPGHVGLLRHNRGFGPAAAQAQLLARLADDLRAEVTRHQPDTLILSAAQLATLPTTSAIARLHALLEPLSRDITIVAHVDEQARVMVRHYGEAVWSGRTAPLERELALAASGDDWRATALEGWQDFDPRRHLFAEVQAVPFWLDYEGLQAAWESVFGAGSMRLRAYDPELFHGENIIKEAMEAFDISEITGKIKPDEPPRQPSAVSLSRARRMNEVLTRLVARGKVIPRPLWRRILNEIARPGAPIRPGSLAPLSKAFEPANKRLIRAHPGLSAACLKRDRALPQWQEADPELGFRATQYGAAFLPRINRATREARQAARAQAKARAKTLAQAENNAPAGLNGHLSPVAEKLFTKAARENYISLKGGRFEPSNRLATPGEDQPAPPFAEITPRDLPPGNTGRVIVGCMKDEAPYILEWIAFHRQIGIDNFLIYTNACSDGTVEILERLQELGIVQHRDNNDWKGNSPQQHALNQSLKEPLIQNAEWVIHIDVDEFMNIRCGNGTVDDLLERVPDATNIAMTWRMFGHNGVTRLADKLVIDQFDRAAPTYCPKPHTVWGFKTMVRNIGAYAKLSCHRPNKLDPARAGDVRWVNGSGRPMGPGVAEHGWRSSLSTIGYDLIQLNHYALRSAESYLIKRQRGRALHVDRSIGLNYWVRMDWSDYRDLSIKRNVARLEAELARLKSDPELARLHRAGFDWHRARARALHQNPEFEELYQNALKTRLAPLERVAYSLALDVQS